LVALTGNHPQAETQVVGLTSRYKIDKNALLNQRVAKIIPKSEERLSTDYIYLFLKDSNTHQYLASQSSGSANQANISKSDIENIPFFLPPKIEQKVIAAVLSSLDDKIDLLHRQNQTLEAMAATLFRQWFVEEAQEDWRDVRLGDYFPVVTGKKDANFSTDDGEYPFFTCSQSAIKAPSYSFEGAAILLSGNGDFNVKRYIGKFEAYQRTYVLIPYDVKYFSFLYTLMKFYLLEITGGYQGSVINFITKGLITEFKFRLPDEHINIDEKLAQFNELYEKIDSNNSQIHTLEKLRDTLLPKLMSGEVRVAYEGVAS
jgi:type I restriction enzyme S subunit